MLGLYLLLRELKKEPGDRRAYLEWAAFCMGVAFGMKLVVAALPTLALIVLLRRPRLVRVAHTAVFFLAGFVAINFELLGGTDAPPKAQSDIASGLILNLFEDVVFSAVLDHMESNPQGSFSWVGHLEGSSVVSSNVLRIAVGGARAGSTSTVDLGSLVTVAVTQL